MRRKARQASFCSTGRRRRWSAVGVALMLVATSCQSGDGDDDAAPAPPSTAGQPVRGGTVVVGLGGQLPGQGTLNPAVNTQGGMQQAAGLLFSGLVEIDEDAKPVPELATRWDIREGGRIYEFTLREGVRFHDGTPLTAADVKWSYEAALLRNHARTQSSIGPALAEPCARAPEPPSCPSIEAVEGSPGSAARVIFRFAKPYAPMLQQLTHTDGAILPRHIWDGKPPPTAATPWPEGQAPVGTGPFKFVSHDPSEIVFERNPDYFRAPEPYLDRVVQRAIPTPAAQVQALTAREIDWLWGVRGQDLPALATNPGVEIVRGSQSAGGSTNCVLKVVNNLWQRGAKPAEVRMGTAPPHPILGDVRVRQAIANALKVDEYVEKVLQNNGGRVANGPISSEMGWAHASTPLPRFDQAEARRLLDEAGWIAAGPGRTRAKDGTPLTIDMPHFSGQEADLGAKLQQDLALVGVEVQLRQVDPAGKNSLYSGREFDTMVVSNCQATDPEIGVRRFYHSSAITGAPFTNGAGYRNPEVDRLFDQAAQNLDQLQRGALYKQASEQIARDLPYIWTLETVSVRAHTKACKGFKAYTGHFAEGAYCSR